MPLMRMAPADSFFGMMRLVKVKSCLLEWQKFCNRMLALAITLAATLAASLAATLATTLGVGLVGDLAADLATADVPWHVAWQCPWHAATCCGVECHAVLARRRAPCPTVPSCLAPWQRAGDADMLACRGMQRHTAPWHAAERHGVHAMRASMGGRGKRGGASAIYTQTPDQPPLAAGMLIGGALYKDY